MTTSGTGAPSTYTLKAGDLDDVDVSVTERGSGRAVLLLHGGAPPVGHRLRRPARRHRPLPRPYPTHPASAAPPAPSRWTVLLLTTVVSLVLLPLLFSLTSSLGG